MSTARVVAGACLGAALAMSTLSLPARADVPDPACGYDVYAGRLTVTSLTAKGDVHVWLKGRDQEVRALRFIRPGETETYVLKHRHSADDFMVAVAARGRKHNDEHLDWCEPA